MSNGMGSLRMRRRIGHTMSTMIRIGLTGGIAAGKSTVATHLRELGAVLIDYDALARKAVEPGSVGLRRIVDRFGPDALDKQGGLNRQWIARHVFSGPNAESERKALDDIEHPLIYELASAAERHALAINPDAVVVHDIPLLAEVMDDLPFRFDHIITVEAPEDVRVERMMRTRGMSERQALDRIAHQASRKKREEISDTVVDSSQSMERMFEYVDTLMRQWLLNTR